MWYLNQGFAVKISEDPLVIKFNFEEESDAEKLSFEGLEELYNREFYLADRENICSICGALKDFARFQTIPHLYRLNFPHLVKTHTSNDIVLLCQPCHDKASKQQDLLKMQLAEKFGFSLTQKSEE